MRCIDLPHVTIIGVYRSPKVPMRQLCAVLRQVLSHSAIWYNVFIGDFNVNWSNQADTLLITDNWYLHIPLTTERL